MEMQLTEIIDDSQTEDARFRSTKRGQESKEPRFPSSEMPCRMINPINLVGETRFLYRSNVAQYIFRAF